MKYFLIILLFIFSTSVKAGLHVGTSLTLLGSDDITPSYNIGYSKFFKNNWVLDFTTNAFYPTKSKFNKRGFAVKSKSTYGAFFAGYKLDKSILSSFVTLVKVDNSIYLNNINIKNYDNKAVVFGGNVTYFPTKNIAGFVFVLLPNTNIDLRYSGGLGVNYYF